MPKIYKKLYEFIANSPKPATKPDVKPAPSKPSVPSPAPSRPSPIRRDKPSTQPKPLGYASEESLYKQFIEVLRKAKKEVKVNINKLK